MRSLLSIVLFFLNIPAIFGQELNCNVIVNLSPQVQTTERRVFQDMELAFSQFLNNRKWTNDNIKIEERIDCNLIITIEDMPSVGSFDATVQIQSARPIYNSSYQSVLLNLAQNYADNDWQFEYVESQPLDFNENSFQNNLTSMLSFYAYIILGMDYDSFGRLSGTPYFEKALTIVNNAQQSGRPGWDQFVTPPRNRYWIAENLMNRQMQPVREAIYEYHRLGLDVFQDDADKGRKNILGSLKKIQAAYKTNPTAFLITLFFFAKTDELVHIFSDGDLSTRRDAYNLLVELQPTKSDKFQDILNN
ncbi:DUF4835 family protein [Fulvivirgaceae bacterium BMA10]|uniref:DUF4835 family protein n=1 Tax=Splendidivirga corallicola TaxID=3051826 RepID=A0ABT8KID8_9BACT|nr:DUF4835 family protein [Fulvivirgaceae bacterium BMA10]